MSRPVVGIEVTDSGTRMVAALSAERGARRWAIRLPEPPAATEAVAQMHALIARALAESGAVTDATPAASVAIGIALAGDVDPARGTVRSVRLAEGWEDFPLAAALSERWRGAAVVRSITHAATLAEARQGAGRGHTDLLYVLLGRNVSAGFVLDGRLYYGAHGEAGALAHWPVRPDGPRCSCGVRGHLEPVASAQSLVRTMIGRAVDHPESNAAMLRISGGRAESMTAEQVVRLAEAGDPVAQSVVDEALDALALALSSLAAALDLDAIVLGGPLAASRAFLDPLDARLRALGAPSQRSTVLLGGELEPAAALIGAVLSAQDAAREQETGGRTRN